MRFIIFVLAFILLSLSSFAQEKESYLHGKIFILKIKKSEPVKLPYTNNFLYLLDAGDGVAHVWISSDSSPDEVERLNRLKPNLYIGNILEKAIRYKVDCKTGKIISSEEIKDFKDVKCSVEKDMCREKDFYYDERCTSKVFPIMEFGKYFTKRWGFTVSVIDNDEIVISYTTNKIERKEVPVYWWKKNSIA